MIVYYSNSINTIVHDPEPLYDSLFLDYKSCKEIEGVKKCPAFLEYCRNIFVIKNLINYEINWNGDVFSSSIRGPQFFNKWVTVRSPEKGLCSYTFPYFQFFSEESLEIELMPPFFHDVDLVRKATMVPGSYNIGKHFRPLETALQFRNKNDVIKFNSEEPIFYLKFKTKEKIQFKKFFFTDELKKTWDLLIIRDNRIKPLQFWYDLFEGSHKKRVLKLIKQNLI